MRFFIGTLILSLGFVATTPMPSFAAALSAEQISQKVNISGRQRMLSQRMAAASCLSMADQGAEHYRALAQSAHDEFRAQLTGLRDGAQDMNLPAEADPGVIAALDAVEAQWARYSVPVQQLAAGYVDTAAVVQVMEYNEDTLRLSNDAVKAIVQAYETATLAPEVARAIDMAGRQRMLSQKMLKEACFLTVGIAVEENSEALRRTKALFETSLNDLRNGNEASGIAPPTSPAVAAQLAEVSVLWNEYKAVLAEKTAAGGASDNSELLRKAYQLAELVLFASHQAVLRYVEASTDQAVSTGAAD